MAKNGTHTAIVLGGPGERPEIKHIPKGLKGMQEAVGGFIQIVPAISHLFGGADVFVDEEGLSKHDVVTLSVAGHNLVGPVLFIGSRGEHTTSLTDTQVRTILQALSGERVAK